MTTGLQRSQSEGNISDNNNNDFFQGFSFLKNSSISEADINSAIKKGEYKKYKKLIKDHNATFITSKENSISLLHRAVTCNNKHANEVKKTISAVLQSGIDINHLDEQGNTPLMHLLNEAAKQEEHSRSGMSFFRKGSNSEKKYSKKNLTGIIKLLVEHGASLEVENEEQNSGTHAHLIDTLVAKKAIDKKEIDDVINTARESLQKEAKEKLSEYVKDIEDVSIYGSCAKIQLKDDKNEFKISEFLQSDFCQKNGISGFSTLHSNGKNGMHGVVSSEGVRHYVVTDGSYEMTLNWSGDQKIKIHISADGTVKVDNEYLEQYKAGKIDVAANKDVKIGNLSLAEALSKGRWKEKEVQHEISETIRSSDRSIDRGVEEPITLANNAINTPKKLQFNPVMTSTPISEGRQRAASEPVIISTSIPEGRQRAASAPMVASTPTSSSPNPSEPSAHSRTPVKKVAPPPPSRRSSLLPEDNSVQKEESNYVGTSTSQSSVPIITVADNAQTYPKRLKEDSWLAGQSWNGQADNHPQNDSSQSVTSRFSSHNVVDDREMNPQKLDGKFEQRKASLQKESKERAEQNSEDRIYNLQSLFADQHVKSENAEHTQDYQPHTSTNVEKEEIGSSTIPKSMSSSTLSDSENDSGYSTPTTDHSQSQTYPKRLHVEQNELTPLEELKKRLSQPTLGLNPANPNDIGHDRAKNEPELLKMFDQKNLGLKQINPNENSNNDSGYSSPTVADHQSQINLTQLKENLRRVEQGTYTKVDDPTQLEKTFDQEKYGLKPVDSSSMSEQTRKRLLEDGLLKNTQTDTKIVDNSTASEHSSTTLPSNNGSDSGYSSPTHTNQDKLQVNPEQLKENLRNVGQNELTLLEEFLNKLDENKKFPLNPVDPSRISNNRVENEPELLKKCKQGLKPVDSSSMSEQTRKRLLEDGLLKDTQTDIKTVDNSTSSEQSSAPKQSTNEFRTHNVQGSEEKIPTYSKNFNQGSLNFNREYYNTSSLFDENEQKTAKPKNTQSNQAEQVMSELEEVFKRRNENKESISVPQITEKNILTVNSHNPFLEQISKDIEGGKLKKGTLKNWVERVQQQESNKGRSV